MFGGNGRRGGSERDLPAVFTPPRDDPATRPRFARSPRELDDWGPDHPTRAATKQACAITVAVFLGFVIVAISVYGMYEVATVVLGRQHFVDCKQQPIENGVVLSAPINSSAALKCDKGYLLEQSPDEQVRCQMVFKKCIVYKRATELVSEVDECERKYLFAPASDPGDVLVGPTATQREMQDHVARLELATYELTRGMCVLSSMVRTQRLFGQRRPGPVPSAVGVTGVAPPAWSAPASAGCLLVLAFVSLGALVVSGVSQAHRGNLHRNRANEPDMAPLMDDDERGALATDDDH